MKKQNKTLNRFVAGGLILAILASIGIGAYLTDTDVKQDVYTVGNVQAEIVSNGDMELNNVGALLPGTVHTYERAATNTGINDAYVFMSLTIPYEMVGVSDTDGTQIGERTRQLFIPGVDGGYISSEWKLVDVGYIGQYEIEDNGQYCGEHDKYSAVVGDTITYVYGFIGDNADGSLKALKSGETTSNLVETMELTNLYHIDKIDGEVSTKLYAIQSNNVNGGLTDVNGVWAVINKAISGEVQEASTLSYSIRNTNNGEAVGYAPLKLVDENGNVVATSVANENGAGQFTNVPAGDYAIQTAVGDLVLTGGSAGYGLRNKTASVTITGEDASVALGLELPVNTLVQGPVFNTYIPDYVTRIEFVAMPQTYGLADRTVPADAIDVSEKVDGSVMAWVEGDTFYVVAVDGGMIYANPNCSSMFQNKVNLEYIGVDNLSMVGAYNGHSIFNSCANLTNGIGDFDLSNLRSLYSAFYQCKWLTEYNLPDNIKYIDTQMFSGSNLTTIVIPEGVETIYAWAFMGCTELKNVYFPSTLKEIGNSAFSYCPSLTSVVIPEGVEVINETAFDRCEALTAINVDPANETYASVDGVLFSKDMKTLIQYPAAKSNTAYAIPEGVAVINSKAFMNAHNLSDISIPSSVVEIGGSAFTGTKWLNDKAASGEIVFVNGIIIDASGVAGDVVLPEGMTEIPSGLFQENKNITSVHIPASVKTIGSSAFANCTSLTAVTFAEGSQLEIVGEQAFRFCWSLTTIELPDTVVTLDYAAFSNCFGLTEITIPAGVTHLQAVFYGCDGLTSVTLPNTLESINNEFNGCSNLTEFIVADDHPTLKVVDGVLYNKDMTTLIKCPEGKIVTDFIVPDSVVSISMSAFSNIPSLRTITLSSNISFLGMVCFSGCENLATINYCGTQAQWNQIYFDYNWNENSSFNVVYNYIAE